MKDKHEIQADALQQAEQSLYAAIVSLRDNTECGNFFRDLCTPAELQALVDRWAVVCLLREGLTYRDINERTGVSVTTIGRVARFLAEGYGGYRTVADRLSSCS